MAGNAAYALAGPVLASGVWLIAGCVPQRHKGAASVHGNCGGPSLSMHSLVEGRATAISYPAVIR